jgi:glycosyltransferase involved in cell wall biosynthesis
MKYAVCIPTYNRPELIPKAVESVLKDPTNPGFPVFVSSDSDSSYRTKEIENLKKICNNHSKIYYTDTERSESYKRQLEKLSGLSREVIDIAMNGGSAGANRNRLILLSSTCGADGIIFIDDDMRVEPGFTEYHLMALGKTVSQFILNSKQFEGTKNKAICYHDLKEYDLRKKIQVFAPHWLWEDVRQRKWKMVCDGLHDLGESVQLDGGNLSLTSLVYNEIPFSTTNSEEDWVLGLFAKKMLDHLGGIVLMTNHPTVYQKEPEPNSEREKKLKEFEYETRNQYGDLVFGELFSIYAHIRDDSSIPVGENYAREIVKRFGKEVESFTQSQKLRELLQNSEKELETVIKEYGFEDTFDAKSIIEKMRKDLYGTAILYQNWSELADTAKRIDPSTLEELLINGSR